MTERIQLLLNTLNQREYRKNRVDKQIDLAPLMEGKDEMMISVLRVTEMLRNETPVYIENDDMGFHRTIINVPTIPMPQDHCGVGNLIPNYKRVMSTGFDAVVEDIKERMKTATEEQNKFYSAILYTIDAIFEYVDRYTAFVKDKNDRLYQALQQVPHREARTFYEACVFLKIITFTIRCNDIALLPLGCFDRYMYSYFENDRKNGVSDEELFETLENLFIALNFDTDLYRGVQQGDNGQSMVLGGINHDGVYEFNDLAHMCLDASLELNLIDPKINIRVNKDTPYELYVKGTHLTKQGMGFPQYCNDDVVIPGLVSVGYDYEDVVDYGVAACWEFIPSNNACDVPNIDQMNFPMVVNNVLHEKLADCTTFEEFVEYVKQGVVDEAQVIMNRSNKRNVIPAAYFSLFIDGCIEKGLDQSQQGAKYNNSGAHGIGIANGADALAAVKKLVFEEKYCDAKTLIDALNANYEGYEELHNRILNCPKMGNNDDYVDEFGVMLMDTYSKAFQGKPNNRGGIFRAGTGSAQGYYYHSKNIPATVCGRKAYEAFGCSFSPAIGSRLDGPLSVVQSFTKYDLTNIINGGPLTIEIHNTTFRNEMGIEKVAKLVKAFIDLGGHQFQLNAINRETLLDAKEHPEKHRNLIVRVWGWSGYFVELDTPFQEHIISRAEYKI